MSKQKILADYALTVEDVINREITRIFIAIIKDDYIGSISHLYTRQYGEAIDIGYEQNNYHAYIDDGAFLELTEKNIYLLDYEKIMATAPEETLFMIKLTDDYEDVLRQMAARYDLKFYTEDELAKLPEYQNLS